MIINFDQTAEYYIERSNQAKSEGSLNEALSFCIKALEKVTKNSPVTKADCLRLKADILFEMQNYSLCINTCFELLLYRSQAKYAYAMLGESFSGLNRYMESIYYLKEKAKHEKDDDTLASIESCMNDVMGEYSKRNSSLRIVSGSEDNVAEFLQKAAICVNQGEYNDALSFINKVPQTSMHYETALELKLQICEETSEIEMARDVSKELLQINSNNVSALFSLVSFCKDREYLEKLIEASNEYYELCDAAIAADSLGEYELAALTAEKAAKLVSTNPFVGIFSAICWHNAKEYKHCEKNLRNVFSVFQDFPSDIIFSGLKKGGHVNVEDFDGDNMPVGMYDIVIKAVRKHTHDIEDFIVTMNASKSYRNAVQMALQSKNEKIIYILCQLFEQSYNITNTRVNKTAIRITQQVFSSALLKLDGSPIAKRMIFAILIKNDTCKNIAEVKGGVFLLTPTKKPKDFEMYPEELKTIYADVASMIPFDNKIRIADFFKKVEAIYCQWNDKYSMIERQDLTIALIMRYLPKQTDNFSLIMAAISEVLGYKLPSNRRCSRIAIIARDFSHLQ